MQALEEGRKMETGWTSNAWDNGLNMRHASQNSVFLAVVSKFMHMVSKFLEIVACLGCLLMKRSPRSNHEHYETNHLKLAHYFNLGFKRTKALPHGKSQKMSPYSQI